MKPDFEKMAAELVGDGQGITQDIMRRIVAECLPKAYAAGYRDGREEQILECFKYGELPPDLPIEEPPT